MTDTAVRYAAGQVWRSRRGHRREILAEPRTGPDSNGVERTWSRVGSNYRDPGYELTVEEMDAWTVKHDATLRGAGPPR